MKCYKIDIEYDGTDFYGWQRQKNDNLRTVQGDIELTLYKIFDKHIKIHGSGRTDRGVHAKGQVASFKVESSIPGNRLKYVMNSFLPDDIYVYNTEEKNIDFHARYNAKGKEYQYLLYISADRSPLMDRYHGYYKNEVDFELMKRAAEKIVGKHDFRGFMAAGSSVNNTVRHIYNLDLEKRKLDDDLIEIKMTINGNGFLYNMVRIIMGTLVDIGTGKKEMSIIDEAYKGFDRTILGHTAKANGLYLNKVFYESLDKEIKIEKC